MNKNDLEKLEKFQLISANVNFALGTLWLLQYTGVMASPEYMSDKLYLGLTIAAYACAAMDMLRYMLGGKQK